MRQRRELTPNHKEYPYKHTYIFYIKNINNNKDFRYIYIYIKR